MPDDLKPFRCLICNAPYSDKDDAENCCETWRTPEPEPRAEPNLPHECGKGTMPDQRPSVLIDGENAVQSDGALRFGSPWIDWRPGDERSTLDGDFTAAELRAIADHMDAGQAT